ncbi:hypothetical protein [Streptomyces sp. H27-C3]|uniref:hypothetical protein n=1 Tax=Streptomyces sp. H27-C3 TaxID=3046305 RepID=UPI0024BA370D|nr:hypothetical protein [Streptomyces sp. H27-C3]MDJ0461937.1 hypothetical protein [Streptomyces sp. H27-C3]
MRTFLSTALIALVAVLVPLSALAVWADREIGNTDRFVSATAPLAADADVQSAVSDRVTDEAMKQIDLGPLQGGAAQLLNDAVTSYTGTPGFQKVWNTVTRTTHQALVDALNNGSGDSVTIDLAPVTAQVKQQLTDSGLPFANQIPVDHTDITVLESDRLGTWRDVFHTLEIAGIWLPIATLLLTATALLLAVRRLRALTALGLALAVGAILLGITVAVARGITLDDLPPDVDRPAAGAVYDALTATLRTTMWVVLAAGLVLAAAAWLTARLRTRRSEPRPVPMKPL